MKRLTPILQPLILGLFLTFLATACGGGDDVSAGTGPDETDETLPESDRDEPVSDGDLSDDDLSDDDARDDAGEPVDTLPEGPLGAGVLATIEVTITHPDAADVTYTVTCLGDTASLVGDVDVNEQTACGRLGDPDVRTRLLDGVPADQMCTQIYGGPDVATITGTYDGVDGPAINTTVDRANGCGISDWDVLLNGVLPQAKGLPQAN